MYQFLKNPILVGVSDIAVRKELNTLELIGGETTRGMEGVYAEHEGRVATVLNKIIQDEVLPEDESSRSEIAVFVSMLKVRSPFFTDWLCNMDAEQIKLYNKTLAEHPDALKKHFEDADITFSSDEEFEEMRKFALDPTGYEVKMEGGKGHYFIQAMELSKEMYGILMSQKSWHLLIAPNEHHFITSDNPVVIQEPEDCPYEAGAGGFLNGTVILSISPRLCLVFRRIPLKTQKIKLNEQDIRAINKSIARGAKRQCYSHVCSKRIKSICDEEIPYDPSKVEIKKIVPFAPYYVTEGLKQYKEIKTLKKFEMPIEEFKELIESNDESLPPHPSVDTWLTLIS